MHRARELLHFYIEDQSLQLYVLLKLLHHQLTMELQLQTAARSNFFSMLQEGDK